MNLVARQVPTKSQRDERQSGSQRGHENRLQAVGRGFHHHATRQSAPGGERTIALHEQHTAAGGDAEEGDKSDEGRDAENLSGHQQCHHAAQQRQRKTQHHDGGVAPRTELTEEQEKYDSDTCRGQPGQQGGGTCFALKLSAELNLIAFGKFDLLCHRGFHRVHRLTDIVGGDIGRNDHFAPGILAGNAVGTGGQNHVSHIRKRDGRSVGTTDGQTADVLHAPFTAAGETKREVTRETVFLDGTDAQTTEGSLHMLRESGECDATGGEERATRTNVNLRALHLLLDV